MLYFKEIIGDLDEEVKKLRLEASSSRFPTVGDHDYIVGTIEGLILAKERIIALKNKLEKIDDFDEDEDPDGEFSAETRKNVRRRVP